jgi:hypothetical protein
MTSFLDKVIKWWKGPTDEEMYERGRKEVDATLSSAMRDTDVEHLFALSHGGFNETPGQNAYDKGVQDRLHELGFESPY